MPKKASTFDKVLFEKEFNKRSKQFQELRDEAKYTLEKKLDAAKIKYHSIPSRIKTLDSCLGKIEKYQFDDPFEQMRDIVGLRVICLFLSDIPKIEELIKKSFVVITSDNKVDGGDLASFRYLSVHHIVRFGSKHRGERYEDIKDIPFEIQVRTIAMDAWANISHYLDYKTEQDIPDELKRDFHALSGMFYVADKHFQLFFEQRKEKQEKLANVFEKGSQKTVSDQPINLDTLRAYLKEKLPTVMESTSDRLSVLVKELIQADYKTIGHLDEKMNGHSKVIAKLKKRKFPQVAVITIILSNIDEAFYKVVVKSRDIKVSTADDDFVLRRWKDLYQA